MKTLTILFLFFSLVVNADTPPPNTVKAKTFTGDGVTGITATGTSLDVNLTNSSITSTVNQGTGGLSPWLVNVNGVVPVSQSGTWTVQQGTPPWSIALPTNASTASNQSTEITALGTINTTLGSPFQAGGSIGNTVFGATQSGTWNVNNISGIISLPTGAATAANQATAITSLGTIVMNTDNIPPNGQTTMAASLPVVIASNQSAIPITGTITATNSANGNTGSLVPVQATQVGGSDGTNLRALKVSSTGVLSVDGSAVTQPVSGTVTANAGTGTFTVGQASGANLHTNVDNFPATQAVTQSGVWTTGRTWTLLNTTDSVNVGNFPATFGVTQNTSPWVVSGTVTSNIGTTNGLALDATLSAPQGSVAGGTAGTKSELAGGVYNTSAPTLTNGQQASLQFDVNGNLKTSGTSTITGSITSNQGTSPWVDNVSQFGGNNVVTGTGASGLGIPRFTVSNDSNILATQSGTWTTGRTWTLLNTTDSVNVGNFPATTAVTQSTSPWVISGTVTANAGTNLNTSALALDTSVNGILVTPGSTTSGEKGPLIQGAVTTASPTYTTAQTNPLSLTTAGALRVDASATTQPVSGTVTANQGGTWTVQQGTPPWSVSQSGAWTTGRTWTLLNTTDSVNAVQSGTWNLNNISGTISLPTGAATSANQTNASQKTQIVDGAGTVIGNASTIGGVNYFPVVTASSATAGAAIPSRAILVAGSDGTNAQNMATDTSGRVKEDTFDGTGTAITSSTFNSKTGLSEIISGQDILTVTGTGSALNGDAIAATDVAAYRDISIQIVVTGTNTTTFQGSNDNFTTVFTAACITAQTSATAAVTTTAASGLFHCPVNFRYFRARITAFTSGSSAGTAIISPEPSDNDLGLRSITGAVTTSGTVTNTPVAQTFSTQVASAAHAASGNSGTLTEAAPNNAIIMEINVTVATGTNETLDLVYQESYDNGTTWTDIWHWERITGVTQVTAPIMLQGSNKIRWAWTIGGTTPSFTFSIGSFQGSSTGMYLKRFFDRNIVPNTLNSTTSTYNIDGCRQVTYGVANTTATTPAVFDLQFSEDGTTFESQGLTITPASGALATVQGVPMNGRFARAIVTTAGTGETLNYAFIKCSGL